MKAKLDKPFWVLLIALALAVVPTMQYDCWTLAANNWIRSSSWTNCYQQFNGHTCGHTYGSLHNCWWWGCGDQAYNYNTIAYMDSGSRYNYGYVWYSTYG